MGLVYHAVNMVNGKGYVGKTVGRLEKRKSWHLSIAKRGGGWCFHRAIRKYGPQSFVWSVLAESDDPAGLGRLEVEYIARLNTKRPGGYNLTIGGDGVIGLDSESRARVVAFHTGRKRSAETRRRLSEAMTGKQIRQGAVLTAETKKRISVALRGRPLSAEHRAKVGAAFKGKSKTPEQKAKMSEARRLWWARKRNATPGVSADEPTVA